MSGWRSKISLPLAGNYSNMPRSLPCSLPRGRWRAASFSTGHIPDSALSSSFGSFMMTNMIWYGMYVVNVVITGMIIATVLSLTDSGWNGLEGFHDRGLLLHTTFFGRFFCGYSTPGMDDLPRDPLRDIFDLSWDNAARGHSESKGRTVCLVLVFRRSGRRRRHEPVRVCVRIFPGGEGVLIVFSPFIQRKKKRKFLDTDYH